MTKRELSSTLKGQIAHIWWGLLVPRGLKEGAGMFFQPLSNPEDWRQLLAKPNEHW